MLYKRFYCRSTSLTCLIILFLLFVKQILPLDLHSLHLEESTEVTIQPRKQEALFQQRGRRIKCLLDFLDTVAHMRFGLENAYLFYATENAYACAALVNIHRLNTIFSTKYRIIALVTPDLSKEYISAFESLGATVIIRDPPPLHSESNEYYTGCLLKLLSFQIHEIIPSIHRILVLDSDQLILKDLDRLFDLPEADLAAPHAYWLPSKEPAISTAFLLIQPNPRTWRMVQRAIDKISANTYDMDLVNEIFGKTALILSGSYVALNSHWADWNLPPWFQAQESLVKEIVGSDNEGKGAGTKTALAEQLYDLQRQAHVLHFTAIGKPWYYAVQNVKTNLPKFHPAFAKQWEDWRVSALQICPEGLFKHV